MKKITYVLAGFLILNTACKKDSTSFTSATSADVTLTYEVITSSGTWFGEYNDKSGTRINTTRTESSPLLPSGWKYTFKPGSRPFQMFITATSSHPCFGTSSSPDVTINFYVNGNLVKSGTDSRTKGEAAIAYDIQ